MFKTLVSASIAALFFSSVSMANVPGVTEGDDTLAQNEEADVLPTARLAQVENDDAIPTAEMFLLFAQNEEGDVLPAERLAQVENDDAIPTAEMFVLFLAQNEEGDVLPAERLAQVEDDAIPAVEMLLSDAQDAVDVLPTEVG